MTKPEAKRLVVMDIQAALRTLGQALRPKGKRHFLTIKEKEAYDKGYRAGWWAGSANERRKWAPS